MHLTTLLRAGALVSENQPLRLSFTSRKASIPRFGVIVELEFRRRQIAEHIFRVLGHRAPHAFENSRLRHAGRPRGSGDGGCRQRGVPGCCPQRSRGSDSIYRRGRSAGNGTRRNRRRRRPVAGLGAHFAGRSFDGRSFVGFGGDRACSTVSNRSASVAPDNSFFLIAPGPRDPEPFRPCPCGNGGGSAWHSFSTFLYRSAYPPGSRKRPRPPPATDRASAGRRPRARADRRGTAWRFPGSGALDVRAGEHIRDGTSPRADGRHEFSTIAAAKFESASDSITSGRFALPSLCQWPR